MNSEFEYASEAQFARWTDKKTIQQSGRAIVTTDRLAIMTTPSASNSRPKQVASELDAAANSRENTPSGNTSH
ncbi:hypothetical protein T265_10999 [Opisthorchis viverrini]|uniref:Uncharacterized protein n=1 Tax=Opisthorchis viverrini TaxID=6198 RepID=A0A074Z4L7_OPIVI|nr:hypothetical protein T265_10999 [Opisthorchis viverrini]KER20467.1 hypothetical protein T265_10999 [Opisthorchis viverrini]